MHIANISYNEQEGRYELHIDEVFKGYSLDPHEDGKKELQQIAESKGYTVEIKEK